MDSFFHVTSQYSNAVLVAILPYVNDCAERLNLAVPRPVRAESVRSFVCDSRVGECGGWITLTNGHEFWFSHGIVDTYESPRDYFSLQNAEEIPLFFGKYKMSRNEAVVMATAAGQWLGGAKIGISRFQPKVVAASSVGTNTLPFFRVEWEIVDGTTSTAMISVIIDAERKQIVKFFRAGQKLWMPPPKLDIVPELEVDYQRRMSQMGGKTNKVEKGASP